VAKVTVRGVGLGCFEAGSGDPPFVFVHGWACDHTFWQPQFDDLSRDHRCLAVDLRGRGDSDATPPFDAITAADDVAAIMAERGVARAIVAGHSLGGIVALLLNERHPELVLGTVLGDSPLGGTVLQYFPSTAARIEEAGSMEPMRSYVESFFLDATPEAVREKVRAAMLSCPPAVAAGMLARSEEYGPRVDDLIRLADRKPLMAFWAEHPLGGPDHLREITMFVRQEPIAGAGHFFQLEQPAITNALLRAFIDDVERDPRL
jgi:pimeloyl-ACP methyl ester carboxylesterase